jgi:hypothetical protein
MQECGVAVKIASFARELLDTMRKQRRGPDALTRPELAVTTDSMDLWSGIPQFNDLFPDYIGEFEDYAELGLFDQGFSEPLHHMPQNPMLPLHDTTVYPPSTMS